jgi:hypothetical protein
MAVESVIVYGPWGAGTRLIRNIISLDTKYDFFDGQGNQGDYSSQETRYNFMLWYYNRPVDQTTWATRDAELTKKQFGKYYSNNIIQYWDNTCNAVYECTGDQSQIDQIFKQAPLAIFDRSKVNAGIINEIPSDWHLLDCRHVFLIPQNVQLITDVYASKNTTIPWLHPSTPDTSRHAQMLLINKLFNLRLLALANILENQHRAVYKYTADELFTDNGHQLIKRVLVDLDIQVADTYTETLHRAWLRDTCKIYQQAYNKELL